MNQIYMLNILLKEMNCMAKEVDYLLSDLSRNESMNEDYKLRFETWYSLFDTELIKDMKEYTDAIIEERRKW